MARIDADLDDGDEAEFRLKAHAKFGFKKGALKLALEEAIREWNASQPRVTMTVNGGAGGDPAKKLPRQQHRK